MCNDFANRIPYHDVTDALRTLGIAAELPDGAPNLEPRDDIRPTDRAPVIAALDSGGAAFRQMRWGFRPARPKGAPVINFRAEGRRFGAGRCLVPASAFYEFTGRSYPKTKWRFTVADADWFCLAGLWRPRAAADGSDAFTLLTVAPGPDIAPYHDRQVVVLDRSDWQRWLDPRVEAADLLQPSPAGLLAVEQVTAAPPDPAAPRLPL
jgi:putative SOS response-associated peptidase YedK